jgi:hypothetical protein
LEAVLYDYYTERLEELGDVKFQQDGAPLHTARSTTTWLLRNSINQFLHPPSSPDLSPIEPLWKTFKNYIRACPHLPTSLNELKTAVREAWDQVTEKNINKHVKHMQDHVLAVLAAKGGHTKY